MGTNETRLLTGDAGIRTVLHHPMDGIGLAGELRRARPDLPLVLASGYITSPERLQPLDVGFVQKPYSGLHVSAALLREIARMRERSASRQSEP